MSQPPPSQPMSQSRKLPLEQLQEWKIFFFLGNFRYDVLMTFPGDCGYDIFLEGYGLDDPRHTELRHCPMDITVFHRCISIGGLVGCNELIQHTYRTHTFKCSPHLYPCV